MQRVLRDTLASQDAAAALEQRVALIRQHFPPSIAHLYAIPRQGRDGVLEWWTELEGQPQPYASLNKDQQAALMQRYQERQGAVTQLAAELQQRNQGSAAGSLQNLIGTPDLANLFSVNGEPLVVRWGQPEPVVAPPPPPPPPPQPRKAPPPPPPPRPAPVVVAVERRRWRLWPWLLLGLLFALLYWLWLSWPLLWARWQSDPTGMCTPGQTFQPSQFTVILDTSGSMNEHLRVKREDDPWYYGVMAKIPIVESFVPAGPGKRTTRMDVAKSSLTSVINNLDENVAMRLVTFNGCRTPVDHGVFGLHKRGELVERIGKINAGGGTALGVSLQAAAQEMDGAYRDGVIVMFVDGRDGCGTDICEVSENIARSKPRLRINIVNISARTGSNCAAENTGGRVYNADDAAAVAAALQEATQEVSQDKGC
ncbi:VWA domain-containing protein [Pseudomonas sp. 148P]|uniref:VWA domain-containing protein n=1 Tax=Pseudomonas ulcerans TaxID=3115852 RepID=A0ABU7HJM7_9PSED|nr:MULTISPECIES: VWA domain-containing protein [unclassified Pseudomonas]MEE1921454.1 VWA domain-containing protein [Pseudomonas sp. 147P]MEE1931737.1 VWA domain-containing protein [Pseudomonas sp. 148P]